MNRPTKMLIIGGVTSILYGYIVHEGLSIPLKSANTATVNRSTEVKEVYQPVEPSEPAMAQTPAEPTQPTAQPTQPAPQESTYKYAAEMEQAGIAKSDFGYVTEMLLDDNGWRTDLSKPIWQRSLSLHGTLVENLSYANRWVIQYHGTWQQANKMFVTAGNF